MSTDPMAAIRAAILPQFTATLEWVKVLDLEAAKSAGTQAARVKEATAYIHDSAPVVDDTDVDVDTVEQVFSTIDSLESLHPVSALLAVDDLIFRLKNRRDDLNESIRTMVNARLKATSAGSDNTETLKAQRAALVVQAKAFATVLDGGEGGDSTAKIPSAPKGSGVGRVSTGGPSVKRSDVEYYRVVKGERKFYSASRDLALIAHHLGTGVEDLKAILATAGVTNLASPFETTVDVPGYKGTNEGKTSTITIGCNVLPKGD